MKKNNLRFLLVLFILFALFILFNQFDITLPPNSYTEKDLGPTIFDKSNGFYLVFALSEPPGADLLSDEIINKYRGLFDPRLGDTDRIRFLWDQMAYRKMFRKYLKKARFINQKKTDWVTFVKSRKKEIVELKSHFSFLLDRCKKLLACEIVSDFSTPCIVAYHPSLPQEYYYPYPDETALLTVTRLYTALRILEILDGRTDAVQSILDQISFAKKLIKSARTSYTNLLGKKVLCLSLQALNSLMNREGCPREIFYQVLKGLSSLKYEEFGSRKAFIGYYLTVKDWIENKIESARRPLLGEVGHLFLQKKRTQYYYFNYVSKCIEYEKQLPFKWKPHQLAARNLQKGSFWWLQNSVGKFLFSKDIKPDLQSDILASYQTKALYDLTRISAELHLNYIHKKPVKEILNHLESYRTPDPYSGNPYIRDEKKAILYSVGANRTDDGGVVNNCQLPEEKMLDIVIPCVLHDK